MRVRGAVCGPGGGEEAGAHRAAGVDEVGRGEEERVEGVGAAQRGGAADGVLVERLSLRAWGVNAGAVAQGGGANTRPLAIWQRRGRKRQRHTVQCIGRAADGCIVDSRWRGSPLQSEQKESQSATRGVDNPLVLARKNAAQATLPHSLAP